MLYIYIYIYTHTYINIYIYRLYDNIYDDILILYDNSIYRIYYICDILLYIYLFMYI